MSYDFKDAEIRNMVIRTHVPEELWKSKSSVIVGLNDRYTTEIRCTGCHGEWPCPARQELTAFWEAIEAEGQKACKPLDYLG